MPKQEATLISELANIAANRLGGNLRLLGVYGSAIADPKTAHDIDFLLVVDSVENCVAYATRDCRDRYASIQFFVLNTFEYAQLPAFYRFQFAFVKPLKGSLALPSPTREDAIVSITQGFTDSLRTLRQQFKRREWSAGDDWVKQVWWNLKSFKYALQDTCWLIRGERPIDTDRTALILQAEGLDNAARAVVEWPEMDVAIRQLSREPIAWVMRWEPIISAAYAEVRKYL